MLTGVNQPTPVAGCIMAPPSYTNWPYVINLSNSIVGVSVLALPFCFKECGVILGIVLLIGCAWLTKKTCHLLMKTAFMTKKRSYEYLAFHVFGPTGKLVVEFSIIGILIGQCIAFYIIIGDLGPAIIAKITGLENTPMLRSVVMTLLAMFVALPLGMLNSLERLSSYSAASLTFYSIFVIQTMFAAFPNLWSGVWLSKVEFWNPEGIFKCLPIFALSFSCHTQLFIIYDALPEASVGRMSSITERAVIFCSIVYLCVGYFGYVAFCDEEISGDILMSFRPTWFNDFVKLGFVMSTVVSFPLVIYPCRASIYTLLFAKVEKSSHNNLVGTVYIPTMHFKMITLTIITFTLIVGILVPNVEFVLAITGATMGSLICYVLPAGMFITVMTFGKSDGKAAAQMVLFIGMTILLASTYVTLNSQDRSQHLESVVKVGQPIVHLDEHGEVAAAPVGEVVAPPVGEVMIDKAEYPDGGIGDTHKITGRLKDEAILGNDVSKSAVPVANVTRVSGNVKPDVKDNSDDVIEIRKEPPNPRAPADDLLPPNRPAPEDIEGDSLHPRVGNQGGLKVKRNEPETVGNNSIRGLLEIQPADGEASVIVRNDTQVDQILFASTKAPEILKMLSNHSGHANIVPAVNDVLLVPQHAAGYEKPVKADTKLLAAGGLVERHKNNLQPQQENREPLLKNIQPGHRSESQHIQQQFEEVRQEQLQEVKVDQLQEIEQVHLQEVKQEQLQEVKPSAVPQTPVQLQDGVLHVEEQQLHDSRLLRLPEVQNRSQKLVESLPASQDEQKLPSNHQDSLAQHVVQPVLLQNQRQKPLQVNAVNNNYRPPPPPQHQQQQHQKPLPLKPLQAKSIIDDASFRNVTVVNDKIDLITKLDESRKIVVDADIGDDAKHGKKLDDDDVQDLLVVIKKQQQEQRELLDVQVKLIDELKRHNKDTQHGNEEV